MITRLRELGVRTVMVTGDAPATAAVVAREVGVEGTVRDASATHAADAPDTVGVYAGVLPEDKFALVRRLQHEGHVVGMCGDGVNDAPALRQAQMGIAVLAATDAAKSAAGVVLTEPGLGAVVAAIEAGRRTYQRILTYALRSIVHKVSQVLFLFLGLLITGEAIITPVLMVVMMTAGDFLAMSSSTDNVRPSRRPSVWHIGRLTIAGIVLGLTNLAFLVGSLLVGHHVLNLDVAHMQTLAVVSLVLSGQAIFYVSRERRRLWSSRPSRWMVLSSLVDVALVGAIAGFGILTPALPVAVIAAVAGGAVVLALVLDSVKVALYRRLSIG